MTVIQTKRLRLDPFAYSDLAALHDLWIMPGVRRYLWDDIVIPREQAAAILEESTRLFETRGFGIWCIRHDRSAHNLIGFGGFWYFREPPELELLVGLHPGQWHRGFATEAASALLRYGFDVLGFASIQGSTDAANIASVRLMERLGMRFQQRAVVGGLDTLFFRITCFADDSPRQAQ